MGECETEKKVYECPNCGKVIVLVIQYKDLGISYLNLETLDGKPLREFKGNSSSQTSEG